MDKEDPIKSQLDKVFYSMKGEIEDGLTGNELIDAIQEACSNIDKSIIFKYVNGTKKNEIKNIRRKSGQTPKVI